MATEVQNPVHIIDPSDKFRPEKNDKIFRDYTTNCALYDRVKNTYRKMHTEQTYDFVTSKKTQWCQLNKGERTILEILEEMDKLVDESDPDVDIPNSVHAFQTAERIREVHPDKDWFILTGLIHDLGKVMAVWGEEQWATVGDTFPVGCMPSDSIVFGRDSFSDNVDLNDPRFSTKLGIYEQNIGLDGVMMSWGHDEYLYQVLKNHKEMHLPEEALYMIRYHSFYPWHTSGDYMYLCNEKDIKMLDWILEFNKFDLYSKSDSVPDSREILPFYESLINKYIPGKLKW